MSDQNPFNQNHTYQIRFVRSQSEKIQEFKD